MQDKLYITIEEMDCGFRVSGGGTMKIAQRCTTKQDVINAVNALMVVYAAPSATGSLNAQQMPGGSQFNPLTYQDAINAAVSYGHAQGLGKLGNSPMFNENYKSSEPPLKEDINPSDQTKAEWNDYLVRTGGGVAPMPIPEFAAWRRGANRARENIDKCLAEKDRIQKEHEAEHKPAPIITPEVQTLIDAAVYAGYHGNIARFLEDVKALKTAANLQDDANQKNAKLMQADYTKKTMALAEERKEMMQKHEKLMGDLRMHLNSYNDCAKDDAK